MNFRRPWRDLGELVALRFEHRGTVLENQAGPPAILQRPWLRSVVADFGELEVRIDAPVGLGCFGQGKFRA